MRRHRSRRHSAAVPLLAAALVASGCGGGGDDPVPPAPPQCSALVPCPAPSSPCLVASCVAGSCTTSPRPAGTAVSHTTGDCRKEVCNGVDGATSSAADDTELPVDGNACTQDLCSAGVPSNPPAAAQTPCLHDGGSRCDGEGACVQCVTAADCVGSDTQCSARTCTDGICRVVLAPFGTPLEGQVPGDCQQAVCDGFGGTSAAILDTDLPADDGNPCTAARCSQGMPSHPPLEQGAACSGEGSATVCDGAGACVQCVHPANCPGTDGECQQRLCDAGLCGIAFTPAGTLVSSQTAQDCMKNVCDGFGSVVAELDDADVVVDGDACTSDLCASGTPTNPDAPAGTACGPSGEQVCDGAGACVACNEGADCPSGVCLDHVCQAPTCTDLTKNGEETDVDCGGPACGDCAASQACSLPEDCTTRICTASRCAAPSCFDGAKNGSETDVDCGGSCTRGCSPGQACLGAADCATGSCPSGTCGGPILTGSVPADGAGDVSPGTAITLVFGNAVSSSTVTAQPTSGSCAGSVQLSADGFATCVGLTGRRIAPSLTTVSFQPAAPLAPGTTYRIRTTGDLSSSGFGAFAPFQTAAGFTTAAGETCGGAVVISQVYAHGGLTGARWANDFVELHNNGPSPVRLDGLSVQIPGGTSWNVTPLSGTIPAGGYHLVALGSSGAEGASLPAADTTGSASLSERGTWVVLASTTVSPPTLACPPALGRLDLVGYGVASGTTPVSCAEVAAAAAPADAGAALVRAGAGCADANGNAKDLVSQLAVPRNGASAPFVCGCNGSAMNGIGVTLEIDFCTVHVPASLAATAGETAGPVYGRVFELGVTEPALTTPALFAELGYGPAGTDPRYAAGWTFTPAEWSAQVGDQDEFRAIFTAPAAGTYVYAYRFSPDGEGWTYCDPNGAGSTPAPGSPFEPNSLPVLTVAPTPPPPPPPDWVLRESFGFGEGNLRPAGGNGEPTSTLAGGLDGFWVEYPGAGSSWTAAHEGWQFAGCSPDPYEPPSPLGEGCTVSPWTDGLAFPDAIVPFAGLAGPYQVSADLFPSPLAGAYVAIGLTSSAALADNLRSSGQLWLLFRHVQPADGFHGEWELRAGGLTGGTVLASGAMFLDGYNPVALRYDPVAQAAYATIRGETFGPFSASVVAPGFLALEGQGVLDNLQVRPVP